MIGRITGCLVSVAFCVVLKAQGVGARSVASMQADAVRAAEIQQRAVPDRPGQQVREPLALREAQRRQFEFQFNQLVDALIRFAERYNEGHGTTWPLHEADKLRKAMVQLQSLEKSLRGERGTTERFPAGTAAVR
jgi:hypothetical protein